MKRADEAFQEIYNRLIPIIILLPVLFLILFIVVSMVQLRDINRRIEEGQSQAVKELLKKTSDSSLISGQQLQFMTLAVLEEESLSERYRQSHYSLVSRSFKQYLGFFTGIIMVIVGSVFVLLKLKENVDFAADQRETLKISLVTTSPGLAFALIGAVLIGIASIAKDTISVRDTGLYLTREYLVAPYFTGNPANGKSEDSEKDMARYLHEQLEETDTNRVSIVHPPDEK